MGMHERMRAMVIRQLALQPKGKGSPASFERRTAGGYNPNTGKTEPSTFASYTTSAVRVNYKDSAYRNETIIYGDFQLYVSPVLDDGTDTPTPIVGDIFTFLGKKCKVVTVGPFNDNGVGCGWKLQVRYG
ncbi:MAG: glutamate 5-kinase [Caudoviricetes sp.]|nr:MAG: glutamate 5-kinase [Caudoviricetes sp.]